MDIYFVLKSKRIAWEQNQRFLYIIIIIPHLRVFVPLLQDDLCAKGIVIYIYKGFWFAMQIVGVVVVVVVVTISVVIGDKELFVSKMKKKKKNVYRSYLLLANL
jgi:hypothetical protein